MRNRTCPGCREVELRKALGLAGRYGNLDGSAAGKLGLGEDSFLASAGWDLLESRFDAGGRGAIFDGLAGSNRAGLSDGKSVSAGPDGTTGVCRREDRVVASSANERLVRLSSGDTAGSSSSFSRKSARAALGSSRSGGCGRLTSGILHLVACWRSATGLGLDSDGALIREGVLAATGRDAASDHVLLSSRSSCTCPSGEGARASGLTDEVWIRDDTGLSKITGYVHDAGDVLGSIRRGGGGSGLRRPGRLDWWRPAERRRPGFPPVVRFGRRGAVRLQPGRSPVPWRHPGHQRP